MRVLRAFEIVIRVVQGLTILYFLNISIWLTNFFDKGTVERHWIISDPTLVPTNTSYDLLTENTEIKIEAVSNDQGSPVLIPRVLELRMPITSNEARFDLFIFIGLLIIVAIVIVGTEQLRKMIRSTYSGAPFLKANIERIYVIATLFMVYPLLKFVQRWLISSIMNERLTLTGLKWEVSISNELPYFLMGMLLFTLSKMLSIGMRIQEEQKLTV